MNILVPPHLRDEVEDNVERILRGEQIQDYETERVRKDGSIVPGLAHAVPPQGRERENRRSFAIIRDITERKRAEEELRRSLEYLELAQAGAGGRSVGLGHSFE